MSIPTKPLGHKAYGSIGHLPQSRLGPADHKVTEGMTRIATRQARDRRDLVVVEEKLDGSCVAVARLDRGIVALGRAGWPARSSKYEQHQLFADWVRENEDRFGALLLPGERIVGEWLAQAHGTRYALTHEPFVAFDLMLGPVRATVDERNLRFGGFFVVPRVIHRGAPFSVADALTAIATSGHGAIDPVEGAVWRVERDGSVDFLAKFVRKEKVDGVYLPETSGKDAVWNWRP